MIDLPTPQERAVVKATVENYLDDDPDLWDFTEQALMKVAMFGLKVLENREQRSPRLIPPKEGMVLCVDV